MRTEWTKSQRWDSKWDVLNEKHTPSGQLLEPLVPLVALFEEVVECLGCRALLERVHHCGGVESLYPHPTEVCLLCFFNVDKRCDVLVFCSYRLLPRLAYHDGLTSRNCEPKSALTSGHGVLSQQWKSNWHIMDLWYRGKGWMQENIPCLLKSVFACKLFKICICMLWVYFMSDDTWFSFHYQTFLFL